MQYAFCGIFYLLSSVNAGSWILDQTCKNALILTRQTSPEGLGARAVYWFMSPVQQSFEKSPIRNVHRIDA